MNKIAKRSLFVLASISLVAGVFSLSSCKKRKAPVSSNSQVTNNSNQVSGNNNSTNESITIDNSHKYDITFFNGGHGQNPDKIVGVPSIPKTLPNLQENGYVFIGWYLDSDFKTPASSSQNLTGNITLYARWIKDTGNVTKSFSITEIAKANSWVSATRYTSLPIDDENLSISVEGGANSGKGYVSSDKTSWDWRMYQTGAGAKITISCVGLIRNIKVTFTSTNEGQLLYNTTIMKSNESIIINDSTCSLVVGGTSSKANGQIRITSIDINYIEGEASLSDKLANLRTSIEGAIKTLSGYSTITKKNIENAEVALNNANGVIENYYSLGGTSSEITSYSTYESIKSKITEFKSQRSFYRQEANKYINELDTYISNESLTDESELNDEQYTQLKNYYDEAVSNSTYYIYNYGPATDLTTISSYQLADSLLEAYHDKQIDLVNYNKIIESYSFDFEKQASSYISAIPSKYGNATINSGMFQRNIPYVSMNFTQVYKSSQLGPYKPVIGKGKLTITANDSLIKGINITLGKVQTYDKGVKLYIYTKDGEEILAKEINGFNGQNEIICNYSIEQDNIHKIVIDLEENTNSIFVNKLTLDLVNCKNSDVVNSYYASIDSSYSGETLWTALETLTSDTHTYKSTYDDCSYLTYLTDYSENNPGQIIDFYSRRLIDGSWDSLKWNREHVYCQSRGWYGDLSSPGAGTDLHHVRPLISNINSSRNNSQYGEIENREQYEKRYNDTLWGYLNGNIGITSVNSSGATITDGVYEPLDNVKGDIARILMYLLVRYRDIMINPNDTHLDNSGNPTYYPITNNFYTKEGTVEAAYAMLVKWNTMDPVDQSELNRNNAVYAIQGNRNPFIDHPEYASLIWSN